MNKLGKREYTMLVADVLVKVNGPSEWGTDVKMAEAVVKKLKRFLYFHPMDISLKEYREWKDKRQAK